MKSKKIFSKKNIIITALAMAAIGLSLWYFLPNQGAAETAADNALTEEQIEIGNISQTITGSAALEAANSYTVTSLVEEEILSADFEEGDTVSKDTVLYQLDSSDAQSDIETNQISLSSSQRSYNNVAESLDELSVTAPISGYITAIDVEVGDNINANQVLGSIRDDSVMEIELPFPADDVANFYLGQSADIILDGSFETVSGTISFIGSLEEVGIGNTILRYVTIAVNNPGGLANGQIATATINGVGSANSASFNYLEERTISAEQSGTVESIIIEEGGYAANGQTIIELSSDTLSDNLQSQSDSVRQAEIRLENAEQTLEQYTITSPIDGTVVEKYYKAGETSEQGQPLCIIYDLSYLTMTLNIDELDISDVEVGQNVIITAEALDNRQYEGQVTKVSVVGSTSSGVTTYPITIQIDEPDGLMPGMNVDATIAITEANQVLTMPLNALSRGNTVLITADSPSAANALDTEAPEGYVYVQVETGISDDSYVEVLSGLVEGDTVAYQGMVLDLGTEEMMMMMPMGGDMPAGGGMPSGGEMPSGGGGGSRPQ